MRLAALIALAVLGSQCTAVQRPVPAVWNRYDCRVIAGPFEGTQEVGPAAEAFGQQPDGVFLVEQYFNSSPLDETRFLDLKTHVLTVSSQRGLSRQPLGAAMAEQVDSLCQAMERGSFRQLCAGTVTEGSRTFLLVKAHGDTILRYEAPHHNYRRLNPDERGKLPKALALIGLIGRHVE